MQPLWIVAAPRPRIAPGSFDQKSCVMVKPGQVYTAGVRAMLQTCEFVRDMAELNGMDAKRWDERLRPRFEDKVMGLALCQPLSSPDVLELLSRQQREQLDYWMQTKYEHRRVVL